MDWLYLPMAITYGITLHWYVNCPVGQAHKWATYTVAGGGYLLLCYAVATGLGLMP